VSHLSASFNARRVSRLEPGQAASAQFTSRPFIQIVSVV
jgi:hypothetical protein